MRLYTEYSSNPKYNAQHNLGHITHYVDDQNLRFHKSRILSTHIIDKGMLFALVESVATDPNNRRRGFRPVVFNVFGSIVSRVSLEDCYSSRKAAEKALWEIVNNMDAKAETLAAIQRRADSCVKDYEDFAEKVFSL